MNIIPEGKEMIWAEGIYKEPIEGIPFSNVGLTLGRARYVEEGDIETAEKMLDDEIERATKRYFDKLASEIKKSRNTLIDQLRVDLDKEYGEKLKKAKEIILEQREEIKLLKEK